MTERRRPRVVKFGGAALADVPRVVEHVKELREAGGPVVVVTSAREGVTDLLVRGARHPRSRALHTAILDSLRARHPGLPPEGRRHLRRLAVLFGQVERSRERDAALVDRILSQGERISAVWLAARLREADLPAVAVEADHLGLVTDNAYGASCILFEESTNSVRRGLRTRFARGEVPVVTGYFGRSLEGRVATLGRGGSDYAAAAIAAMLGAREVELVKRHVAVLSADPRIVARARALSSLSYEEAEELAQFGAQVLHPLTIEPARAYGVVVRVRSLEDPELVTTIGPSDSARRNRALTLLRPLRLLRLRVPGGRQRPGIVAEVSRRLAEARVNLVQLYTSSALLCLVLAPEGVLPGLRALAPLTRAASVMVEGPFRVSLLTVIGDGVLAEVDRLPASRLRRAEGFSATPRALSLAVPEEEGEATIGDLHRALVEDGPP